MTHEPTVGTDDRVRRARITVDDDEPVVGVGCVVGHPSGAERTRRDWNLLVQSPQPRGDRAHGILWSLEPFAGHRTGAVQTPSDQHLPEIVTAEVEHLRHGMPDRACPVQPCALVVEVDAAAERVPLEEPVTRDERVAADLVRPDDVVDPFGECPHEVGHLDRSGRRSGYHVPLTIGRASR